MVPQIRLLTIGVTIAAVVGMAGCTTVKVSRLNPDAGRSQSSAGQLRALAKKEREALSKDLVGEIQTVYPSDTGLARVYGQVANLGQRGFAAAEFEVIAEIKSKDSQDSKETKVVATFGVDGLQPQSIKPFDVQTTVPVSDAGSLQVLVRAVR